MATGRRLAIEFELLTFRFRAPQRQMSRSFAGSPVKQVVRLSGRPSDRSSDFAGCFSRKSLKPRPVSRGTLVAIREPEDTDMLRRIPLVALGAAVVFSACGANITSKPGDIGQGGDAGAGGQGGAGQTAGASMAAGGASTAAGGASMVTGGPPPASGGAGQAAGAMAGPAGP